MYVLRQGLGMMEKMGPPVDPNTPIPESSGSMLDQLQAEIEALYYYTGAGQQPRESVGPIAGESERGFTSFLNQNAGKIMIGAGAFVALMLFAKAGR